MAQGSEKVRVAKATPKAPATALEPPAADPAPPRKPRVRARVGRRQRRPLVLRRPGTVGLVVFALVTLGIFAAGLLSAYLTIFAPAHPASGTGSAQSTPTPASSSLVGHPIDGTLVAVSVTSNLVAVQPASGSPLQGTVTSSTKITRNGSTVPLASLIPGEAVVVTFSAGPGGTLVVAQLQDVVSLPTNTPSPTFVAPSPTFSSPSSPPPTPHPTGGPGGGATP